MSSEIVVALVLLALAVGGCIYLEMNSRRNRRSEMQKTSPDKRD